MFYYPKRELLEHAANRARRKPTCPRNRGNPAIAQRTNLCRRKQSAAALAQRPPPHLVVVANRHFINHPATLQIAGAQVNPLPLTPITRCTYLADVLR